MGFTASLSNQMKKCKCCIVICKDILDCERFEPRSHFISWLSMIVWLRVILNRTVVDSDWHLSNLCSSRHSRPLTLVRLTETWDCLHTNERHWRNGDVNNHIIVNTLYRPNNKSTGTLRHALSNDSTDFFRGLTLESWSTKLEQMSLNHSQQFPASYKHLINGLRQIKLWLRVWLDNQ